MKIAVEGCAHGELDNIYNTIKCLEEREGFKIDLLICCGDFQASRNENDLRCMAVPPKYYRICSFYKYYTGEKIAPVLTIFIGGNHEASNHLQELPYGGWVAPKIYYLGYAGVINIAGIRIGGISGIYKARDYMKGHFEFCPYSDDTKRSVYHIRNLEVFRLKQLSEPLNIFLSHDWPSGIWEYGDKEQLIRFKPFFEEDMKNGRLGSKPTEELLSTLKPEYWFAAHLHCKFAAVIPHNCGKITKFLALDKCLPKKRFLQIVDIPHNPNLKNEICYDLEWLTILRMTNHLLSVKNVANYMPGPTGNERWCFTPTEEDKTGTFIMLGNDLVVPNNFVRTAEGYTDQKTTRSNQPHAVSNPQTVSICRKSCIDDPLSILLNLDVSENTNFDGTTEGVDSQTFIEDSELSVDSQVQKKIVLNLPEPIGDDVTFKDDILNEKETSPDEDTETSQDIDCDVSEKAAEAEINVTKKFKRRNASIYQHGDGDN